MRAWAAFALAVASAACASTAQVRRPDAALAVECDVAEARVYVDDTFVGRADELALRPAPVHAGARRVEVRADGYFSAFRDVAIAPGERARMRVGLHRVPDGDSGG
jgi:hypothetical protein